MGGFPIDLFLEKQKVQDFICAICTEVCRDAVETKFVNSVLALLFVVCCLLLFVVCCLCCLCCLFVWSDKVWGSASVKNEIELKWKTSINTQTQNRPTQYHDMGSLFGDGC